jgi:hypothetical protein
MGSKENNRITISIARDSVALKYFDYYLYAIPKVGELNKKPISGIAPWKRPVQK